MDLISRQKVLYYLNVLIVNVGRCNGKGIFAEILSDYAEYVKSLPCKPGIDWTPATKKPFPDEEGEYLVTAICHYESETGKLGPGTLSMNYVRTSVRGKPVERWEWKNRISSWDVIAWAPMPEPYIEESAGGEK